ncbi:anti-sigma factor [uncultured Nevskia sp.]|uniref:anti-sigma factor n=1 Tax=uncultured Nevskia sp. TaxID=228950 RepID=UPI0025E57E06|nr:anti-sigma factor [uncultured Nevskia sp.]
MKYDNAKLRQMLAAEYVLGTLRGRARRRFERLASADAATRAEIRFWETRLAGLAANLAPQTPPPAIWQNLEQQIGLERPSTVTPIRTPAPAPSKMPTRAANDSPPPAPLWRIFAGLATAAAVVIAVLIGTRVPLPGTAPVPVAAAPATPEPTQLASTVYVSLLKLPESTMQWTLSVHPEADEVKAVASGEYPKLGEHSLELWLITDAGPVSLGLLPTTGSGTMKMPAGIKGDQLTLAVSLEPVGGSPTGQPTGPVLTSGPAIKAV